MKTLQLLCNAHLDPVWLWKREEGIAEAISTFRISAKFCEEYDGFVFNHNESVLYEWVEENEPGLFKKIQKLVKEGKWHIMGGWFLQPDCLMPSGESFIRQIEVGNRYFMEKFGVKPTTAINFDPFGHSRGLVQILKKAGYDSYVFMRPYDFCKERNFIWRGYDGSEIIANCTNNSYNTNRGMAVSKIEKTLQEVEGDNILMLWGIGNHGGGPSKIDMDAIEKYIKEHPEVKILHSWCEKYFDSLDKSELQVIDKSLVHCMVGCYSTMSRIKKMHRLMESELSMCETMLCLSGAEYDKEELSKAEKALLFCEFHDILPGTVIKKGEEDALRYMDYGREILSQYTAKAFFKLCEGQKQAKSGEIPVMVFNPNPYRIKEVVEVEFQLEDQNWNDNEVTLVRVRDKNGKYVPTQNEQEDSNLNLDWRKRIAFLAELEPMSINRFDCELYIEKLDRRPIADAIVTDEHFVFENEKMTVKISKKTGLIDKYTVNGEDYLNSGSAKINAYCDNEDPWGMRVDGFYDKIGEFVLLPDDEANAFNGYSDEKYENVRIIENGDVRAKLQATFKCADSYALVTYIIPKQGEFVDINIKILSNNASRMYKLSFDTTCKKDSAFIGQSAFGREELLKEGKEVTYQKWCAFSDDEKGFAVLNNGTYAASAVDNILNITLMRTPVYSAHPIKNKNICDHDRWHEHIDMGEREFSYRLSADLENVDFNAQIFNQPVYALSFFPSGLGDEKNTKIEIENKKILLSRCKNEKDGLFVRLFNSSDKDEKTSFTVFGQFFDISFKPYEIKSFIVDKDEFYGCDLIVL